MQYVSRQKHKKRGKIIITENKEQITGGTGNEKILQNY